MENQINTNTVSEEIFSVSKYLDISKLPDIFNFSGVDTLPVIDKFGMIVGIVSEFDLAKVAKKLSFDEESYQSHITVEDIMAKNVRVVPENSDLTNLFDHLEKMHTRFFPVVDDEGFYTGKCITRTKLINFLAKKIKPRTISGVATPMGVYLSDGVHQAGVKNLGLILNGMVFALFFIVAEFFTASVTNPLLGTFAKLFLFLVFFKLSPLSQIHSSEHKVINAIEKGLPLDVETVQKQSAIHARCGTNLLVLFVGISTIFYITNMIIPKIWFLRFTVSFLLLVGLFGYWKQIGFFIQKIFTTKTPDEKQLKSAIKVGAELLHLSKAEPKDKNLSFLSLIYTSGIIQIVVSFLLFINIFNLLLYHMVE